VRQTPWSPWSRDVQVHEVALVAQLVEATSERAAGRPVELVRIRYATTIPADVLEQAWTMLVAGGPLEGALLDAEPVDVRLACPCGFDGALGHDDVLGPGQAVCPACSELRAVQVTPELELLEVRSAT
jgi:Zn finger protein HypA/HybF involved in hydrogenase expression